MVANGRAAGVVTVDGRRHLARDAVIGAIHPHLLGIDGRGHGSRGAQGGRGHADHRGGLHHRPRRARRAAAVPHAATGAVGDDRAAAGELPRAARVLRRTALWRLHAHAAAGPGLAVAVRPHARAAGQGRSCTSGTTCPTSAPTAAAGTRASGTTPAACSSACAYSSRTSTRCCSTTTATARSTWSAPRRASAAATCTASRPPPIRAARTGRRRSSASTTVPGLDRFYLVGPFQYPGGGVFGAGRATAQVMFEELKLDFERRGAARHEALRHRLARADDGRARIERDGKRCVIKGKVFGAMPMTVALTPGGRARRHETAWLVAGIVVPADDAVAQVHAANERRRT